MAHSYRNKFESKEVRWRICRRERAALQRSRTGRKNDPAGPEALDHFEVAKIVSKASGRTVMYHLLTEEQMLEGARSQGMPEPVVAYLAMLYSVVHAGNAAGITPYPETITGQKPLTFEAFAEAEDWKEESK